MNPPRSPLPDDATLVAWLDGELDAPAATGVASAVAAHPPLAMRVQLLRATRDELAAMAPADHAPAAPPRRPRANLTLWLIAAAALGIVVALATARRTGDAALAENDLLELRLVPLQPAWDLFTAIRFELEGRAKTTTPCRIVARQKDETDEQLAARVAGELVAVRVAGELPDHPALSLVLDAELTDPAGRTRSGPVVRVHGEFGAAPSRLEVELVDVVLPHDGISPFVTAELRPGGVSEGCVFGQQRVGGPAVSGAHGCVPEEPGEYRITFRLRSFAAGNGHGNTFGEPLAVATGFAVRGITGAWSEPVDGLRARLVAPPGPATPGGPLPFALQLRNESGRARCYNVIGATLAPVPQPFHFELQLDGARCTPRRDAPLVFSSDGNFLLQPPGTLRSVVALADYWLLGGDRPSALRGRHQLAAQFHFVPTTWAGGDELWQGKVQTPPIEVDFGPAR